VLQAPREAIHKVVAAFFVNIDGSQAIALAQDFARRMRHRTPTARDPWLARAIKSGLSVFQRFAKRLWEDYDTVKAGVALPWSHGPVEGQYQPPQNAQAPDVRPRRR